MYTRADKITDFPDWADNLFGEVWEALEEGRHQDWETVGQVLVETAQEEIDDELEERGLTAEQIGSKIGADIKDLEEDYRES